MDPEGRQASGPESAEDATSEEEAEEDDDGEEGDSSLLIVLLDPQGEGVRDARVSIESDRGSRRASTERGGEAFFDDLPAGSYSYSVKVEDRPPLTSNAPIEIEEGERRTLTLRLGERGLSISGRVLNRQGEPVVGIEVVAQRQAGASPEELIPSVPGDHRARTQGEGYYEIGGLDQGIYRVALAQGGTPPAKSIVVRAGDESADLILDEGDRIRVYGLVTDMRGEPLSGVRVLALGVGAAPVSTGEDGTYQVSVSLAHAGAAPYLEFVRSGYTTVRANASRGPSGRASDVRLDATLEEAGQSVRVTGNVRSSYGDPLSRERIRLYSPRLRREIHALSDAEGNFVFPNVEVSSDYHFSVRPTELYADFTQSPVSISSDRFFQVVLEPLAVGLLQGTMVDPEGFPLPNFRLWLRTDRSRDLSRPVSGDGSGYFVVEDAPDGNLQFETRSSPSLRVTGMRMEPGGRAEVVLVLDWGSHEVHGRVLDAQGAPIGGADVSLTWSSQSGAIRSTSMRQTATDADGWYRFTQVGPGQHYVNVRREGFTSVTRTHLVAGDTPPLELRLNPAGG